MFKNKIFKHIKSFKKKVGISLNPNTEINIIENELKNVDLILVMSVYPGFGGQKFIPDVIKKIKLLKKLKDDKNYEYDIEVDGGINFSNANEIIYIYEKTSKIKNIILL